MLNGYLYQLSSMLSFGISNLLWKYPQQDMPVYKIITLRSMLTTLLFGVLAYYLAEGESSLYGWFLAIGISAVSFWGLLFYNLALKHSTVCQSITVTSASAIFGVATSIIAYNEPLTLNLLIALSLIILGLFFLEKKKPILKWGKGTFYALLAAFFWGTTFALFRLPINELGGLRFSFSLEATVCLSALILMLFNKQKEKNNKIQTPKKVITTQSYLIIVLLAILCFGGVFFYNKAVLLAPVSELSVMGSFTPVITIIASHLLLKERFKPIQYLGMALTTSAVILLLF